MAPRAEVPGARGWRGALAEFAALWRAPEPDTDLMRASSAAVLEGPGRAAHAVLWSVLAFVIVALIWAALAQIDQIVVGSGKVIPSSQLQRVQNLEGGIVSAILVQTGDAVKKGQVVMQLDATRFNSTFQEGQAKDQALIARVARLSAEADGVPFAPPAELLHANPAIIAQEQAVYDSRRRELDANLVVLRQQERQRGQELEEMRAKERQLETSHQFAQRELDLTRPLAQQGAVSEVELLRTERQTQDLAGALEASRLAVPRLESALAEVRGKVAGFQAQFRAKAADELSSVRGEQTALSAANVGLQDRVARTLVRAPMAGIVKQLKVNTVGGVIQPGVDLMEIVPIEDSLLIEARVKPSDIAFLRIGQLAIVKLSAYDFSIYGGLEGRLEHISADTLTPEDPGEKRESYYQIRVRTQTSKLDAEGTPLSILPGMEATVDVRTGRRTVLHYLLKPILKTREKALREP